MIFGEIIHKENYYDMFPGLLELISSTFESVEFGVQGDAYIWIFDKNEKVTLDTFTSMRFQLKSAQIGGVLIERVISVLEDNYQVYLYEVPEVEGHEDLD